MGRKPRSTIVTVDLGRPAAVDAVSFDRKTGEFVLFNKGSISYKPRPIGKLSDKKILADMSI